MTPKKETSASPRVYRQLKIDKAKLKRALIRTSENLAKSGGGGDNGGMEDRVTRLEVIAENQEKKLDLMTSKLDDISNNLSRIEGRLNAMPTNYSMTITMIVFVLTVLGLAAYFN